MKIFVSYRASDMDGQAPLFVAKIVKRLRAQYGPDSVTMDMGVLPAGGNLKAFMTGLIRQTDVFLAVIGPSWAEAMRRHAEDEQDFVRVQVEAALGLGIPIMPVVIDTTPMPGPDELPDSVWGIVEKQRFRLSSGAELGTQLGQLMQHLQAAAPQATVAVASPAAAVRKVRENQPKRRGHTSALAWLLATALVGFLAMTVVPRFQPLPEKPRRDPTNDYLNSIGDRMVWCQPGTFVMGSPETEVGHSPDELAHEVTINQGFWIGAHEITQAQWKLVMGEFHTSYRKPFGTAAPVTNLDWEEAMAFCAALSEREGRFYQLPTEAQWEYACRAGTTGPYNVEGAQLSAMAWHIGNSGGSPQLVGQKARNNWGLQDMHGNVFEWCLDWYAPYAAAPVADPKGPETGEFKIYRSSGYDIADPYHRSAYRSWNKPTHKASNLGFRVAALAKGGAAHPAAAAATKAQTEATKGNSSETPASLREEEIAPDVKVRFLFCPPGQFTMGEGAAARAVTITQGFWLGETEISRAQWIAVMGKIKSSGPNRGNRVPIDQIGWDDIAGRGGFLQKLQSKAPAGFVYALPTEAQWEYACRAGTTTTYSWGEDFLPGSANVANAPGSPESSQVAYFESKGLPTGATMTVKSLKPNPWGFYDMHGNVWEWCRDWYEEVPSGPTTDPQGPATGDLKLLKGGSWNDPEKEVRSAARLRYFPTFRGPTFGFRLALIPQP